MKLSQLQLQKLNAYVGCGPHLDADLLIMGNEEGTGGYPNEIPAHAAARFRLYGKDEAAVASLLGQMDADRNALYRDEQYAEEPYAHAPNGDWEQGFWEPSANSGAEKIERYMLRYYGALPDKTMEKRSLFNTYTARLCLTLKGAREHADFPVDTFLSGDTRKDDIHAYAEEQLFTPNPIGGFSSALMDWRPLPRPNEGGWPEEYDGLFQSESEYMDAFDFKNSATDKMKAFVNDRLSFLKSVIVSSRAEYLITIGKVDNKRELLQRMFPDQPLDFRRIPISNRSYETVIQLPDRKLRVYVMAFFQNFSIANLRCFAKYHLVPDYLGQERPKHGGESAIPEPGSFERGKRALPMKQTAFAVSESAAAIAGERTNENAAPNDGAAELAFLAALRERVTGFEPDVMTSSPHRAARNDVNYMFLWAREGHWERDKCQFEVHVNFHPATKVKISWRLRKDGYAEPLRSKLLNTAERIGEALSAFGYQPNARAKEYVHFQKIVSSSQDGLVLDDCAAEIRRALQVAAAMLAAI